MNQAGPDRDDAHSLLQNLTDTLTENGDLRTPAWHKAFLATPRHPFVPRFWLPDDNGTMVLVTSDSPDWLPAIYTDDTLVTQFNGDPDASAGIPTSSSTAPSLMLRMLEALDVQDGHRVLEIGTGTGYNAALLSNRLGDRHVTTIDVDPDLTARAEQHLAEAGVHPTVVTGDGALGHPENAPYDRIIATCAMRHIPPAWLHQTKPGGSIMATLETGLNGQAVLLITSNGDGTGTGHILPEAGYFMLMRSHTSPRYNTLKANAAPAGQTRHSELRPGDLTSNETRFIIGLAVPDVTSVDLIDDNGERSLYLAHHHDRSWVEAKLDGTITEGGPQELWARLEQAHEQRSTAGTPRPDQLRVTLAREQQTIHSDDETLTYQLPRS